MKNKLYLQLEDEIINEENMDFEDEELVLKSLNNPRLFELFVEKYQDTFFRTANRILKDKEETDDVVQDAFVKIYYNVKKFQKRPGIKFKSWAFKILINCVFTRYKKAKKRKGQAEFLDEVLYFEGGNFDSGFEMKEKRDEIESILARMPEDFGELIKKHYLEDRPYAEIASERGMSIPALKMKLFRARKKFKGVREDIN